MNRCLIIALLFCYSSAGLSQTNTPSLGSCPTHQYFKSMFRQMEY